MVEAPRQSTVACKRCGSQGPAAAIFCPQCGAPFRSDHVRRFPIRMAGALLLVATLLVGGGLILSADRITEALPFGVPAISGYEPALLLAEDGRVSIIEVPSSRSTELTQYLGGIELGWTPDGKHALVARQVAFSSAWELLAYQSGRPTRSWQLSECAGRPHLWASNRRVYVSGCGAESHFIVELGLEAQGRWAVGQMLAVSPRGDVVVILEAGRAVIERTADGARSSLNIPIESGYAFTWISDTEAIISTYEDGKRKSLWRIAAADASFQTLSPFEELPRAGRYLVDDDIVFDSQGDKAEFVGVRHPRGVIELVRSECDECQLSYGIYGSSFLGFDPSGKYFAATLYASEYQSGRLYVVGDAGSVVLSRPPVRSLEAVWRPSGVANPELEQISGEWRSTVFGPLTSHELEGGRPGQVVSAGAALDVDGLSLTVSVRAVPACGISSRIYELRMRNAGKDRLKGVDPGHFMADDDVLAIVAYGPPADPVCRPTNNRTVFLQNSERGDLETGEEYVVLFVPKSAATRANEVSQQTWGTSVLWRLTK